MKDKNIIPREYRRSDNTSDFDDIKRYLKDKEIKPEEALKYIIEASRVDPTHPRTQWKLLRFTMYLWERLKEQDTMGKFRKKKDTCFEVVNQKKYKDLYSAFSFNPRKFDELKEATNLFKLVGDDRQTPFFKKRFYFYEKTKTNIPQDIIDKIR